jgi:hypothetical protein
MTIDNKIYNKSQQTGLESFFPSLINILDKDKNKGLIKNKKEKKVVTILIQRRSPNSDIWICNNCTWTGDKWFMEKHPCRQNINNNFAKVAQQFHEYSLKVKNNLLS